jgi:hypothetical protein
MVMPATPTAPLAVALKVLLDQALQTPLGYCLFFSSMKLLEGRPAEAAPAIRAKVRMRRLLRACVAFKARVRMVVVQIALEQARCLFQLTQAVLAAGSGDHTSRATRTLSVPSEAPP